MSWTELPPPPEMAPTPSKTRPPPVPSIVIAVIQIFCCDCGSPTWQRAGSWPADARGRGSGGPQLARLCLIVHALGTAPVGGHHEQGGPARAAECAREAAAVQLDGLQHLSSLAHPHAPLVGNVGVPDGSLVVEAD